MRLERKMYTRKEKLALKELYTATKGFKELPRTGNPKDVLRLQRFATDLRKLSVGDSKNFDRENARKLLKSADLPISSSEVDHVIDKYTDKRALARLRRLKQHQESVPVSSGERLRNSASGLAQFMKADLQIMGFKAQSRLRKNNQPDVINKLNDIANKRDITIKRGPIDKASTPVHKDTGEIIASNKRVPKEYRRKLRQVEINSNYSPEILAHELGHVRSHMSPVQHVTYDFDFPKPNLKSSRSRNIRQANKNLIDFSRGFGKIAEENNANSYGEAMIRRAGGDVDRMRRASMNNQNNYIGSARVDLNFLSKPRI